MQTIDYSIHVRMLIRAAVLFSLVTCLINVLDLTGNSYLIISFGSMGALHSAALLFSFHERAAIKVSKSVIFVALVALASIGTFFSLIVMSPLLGFLNQFKFTWHDEFNFFTMLVFASASGAFAYWMLLRIFWLKDRKWSGLGLALCLCAIATLGSWMIPNLLPFWMKDYFVLIPTFAWWAAFSLSLYLHDRQTGRSQEQLGNPLPA